MESAPAGIPIYKDLRNNALALTPERLGLPDTGETRVLAILMETGYPEGVATLVAVADGSASLYFSRGGGILGGGDHAGVRTEALRLVEGAGLFLDAFERAVECPPPSCAWTSFHVVTTKGIRSAGAREDDLGGGRHALSALFHQGHALIGALHGLTERGPTGP